MASDITSGCTITQMGFALGQSKYKKIVIVTAATADSDDYITLTPASWGTIMGVIGYQTSTSSQEQPTWVVASGVITLGGSSNDDVTRYFEVLVKK